MEQPKKTMAEVCAIVHSINFMDRRLVVAAMGDGYYVQVQYVEICIDSMKPEVQKARKWYVSPFSTETEIVETCFKACRTSMEHVLKEHFLYKGHRIYSPHFNVNARIQMCTEKKFDGRIPPKK